jgi:hypothetical protein
MVCLDSEELNEEKDGTASISIVAALPYGISRGALYSEVNCGLLSIYCCNQQSPTF